MAEFTETELLRQRPADAEAKIEELTTEVDNLEDKLQVTQSRAEQAKFYECDDSNGCYDDCGRVHIHDAEELSFVYSSANGTMRTVYHKVGE